MLIEHRGSASQAPENSLSPDAKPCDSVGSSRRTARSHEQCASATGFAFKPSQHGPDPAECAAGGSAIREALTSTQLQSMNVLKELSKQHTRRRFNRFYPPRGKAASHHRSHKDLIYVKLRTVTFVLSTRISIFNDFWICRLFCRKRDAHSFHTSVPPELHEKWSISLCFLITE